MSNQGEESNNPMNGVDEKLEIKAAATISCNPPVIELGAHRNLMREARSN